MPKLILTYRISLTHFGFSFLFLSASNLSIATYSTSVPPTALTEMSIDTIMIIYEKIRMPIGRGTEHLAFHNLV